MQNMIITVLAGIILAAAIRLRKKNRELGRLKEQIHQVKEETKALQAQVKILDSAKQQKLLQAQAGYYPGKQGVAYCNSCYQARGSLNIERFHLLDLIFR